MGGFGLGVMYYELPGHVEEWIGGSVWGFWMGVGG